MSKMPWAFEDTDLTLEDALIIERLLHRMFDPVVTKENWPIIQHAVGRAFNDYSSSFHD